MLVSCEVLVLFFVVSTYTGRHSDDEYDKMDPKSHILDTVSTISQGKHD